MSFNNPGAILIYTPENESPSRKGNRILNGVLLKPGRNHLNSEEYELALKHFDFKTLEKTKVIEALGKQEVLEAELKEDNKYALAGLNVDDSLKLIRKETSLITLSDWRDLEPLYKKRVTVTNAISQQIKDIEDGRL